MNEDEAFIRIKDMIHAEKDLDVSRYKENYLKRRLAVRMRSLSKSTYNEYMQVLEKDRNEFNLMLDKLTINVTQFFRDPEIFIELENVVLPEMIRRNKDEGIKVWSAGCSTGEEPYSIAISIEEAADRMGVRTPYYEIHATDLDQDAICRAVDGRYEGRTMDNIAEARRKKYFEFDGKRWAVRGSIKDRVKFVKFNLMEPYKKNYFDLVFCRNVIIYFTRELQSTVLGHYHESLRENGILFLGKTETMLSDFRDRFECINIKERIFKKV